MRQLSKKTFKTILDNAPLLCVDIVAEHKGKYLLVKRKNRPFKGTFWLPGGRVIKNETIVEAVKRKMKEETGLNVKILQPLGYFEYFFKDHELNLKNGYHPVSIVYLVELPSLRVNLDSQSSNWKLVKNLPKKFAIKPFNKYGK